MKRLFTSITLASLAAGVYAQNVVFHNNIQDIDGNQESLWIATSTGAVRLNISDNQKDFYYSAQGLSGNNLYAVACDDEKVYFGSSKEGLSVYSNGSISVQNDLFKEGYNKNIYGLKCFGKNKLAVGGLLNIYTMENGVDQKYHSELSDLSSFVAYYDFAADNNGNIWFCGWDLLKKSSFGYITKDKELVCIPGIYQSNSLAIDNEGCVWIGSERGLYKYDGKELTRYTSNDLGTPSDAVFGLCKTIDGRLLFGSKNNLAIFDGKKVVEQINVPTDNSKDFVTTIFPGEDAIWVGTALSGLFKYQDGEMTKIDLTDKNAPEISLGEQPMIGQESTNEQTNVDSILSNMKFKFQLPTAIPVVKADQAPSSPIFDLSGKKTSQVEKGKIYIQNRKKFMIK